MLGLTTKVSHLSNVLCLKKLPRPFCILSQLLLKYIIIINWIIYCSGTAKNDKTNSSKLTDLNLKYILHIGATFPPFSSRDWIQGLLKARHTLCKWYIPRSLGKYSASEIHPRSFYFLYWDGVSLVAQVGLELIL